MVKKRLWLVILLIVFGVLMISCSEDTETTYTVWTDSSTYSEFLSQFGALSDGYYVSIELTNIEFNQMSPSLTNEYKHEWTEKQIHDWFIGRGFGTIEANKETAWLLTINHGFIASRSGSIVYMILK